MSYYIKTTVTLKFGQIPGYSAMMAELVPFMARHGWKLVFGLQPFVGDLTEIAHIWEVERFGDIERALNACKDDPAAHAILAPMPDLLHNEAMQIMVKTSYSP
jgi:hypothetical protein